MLVLSLLMALLLALVSSVRRGRFAVSDQGFAHATDFCTLLLVALVAYAVLTLKAMDVVFFPVQAFPFVIFPLLIAQYLSKEQSIPVAAMLLSQRSGRWPTLQLRPLRISLQQRQPRMKLDQRIDARFYFFGICLISAGAYQPEQLLTYLVPLLLLLLYAIYHLNARLRGAARWWWPMMVSLSVVSGLIFAYGLHSLHMQIQQAVVEWLIVGNEADDERRTSMALGHLGELKLSRTIVFRLRSARALPMPFRLRKASYNRYFSEQWMQSSSLHIQPVKLDASWWLHPKNNQVDSHTMQFWQSFDGNDSLLPLPEHAVRITGLKAASLHAGALGSIRISHPPSFAHWQVGSQQQTTLSPPPQEADRNIARQERDTIDQVLQSLALDTLSEQEKVARIQLFLATGFRYSLWREQTAHPSSTLLQGFLLHSKQGHCEYFATATVMLLRAAGLPARYATGYSVSEYDRALNMYVVRARDAHAWAEVWLQGSWQQVDTTPADWRHQEEQLLSHWWDMLVDQWDQGYFQYQQWKQRSDEAVVTGVWLLLLITLFLFLSWRIARKIKQGVQQEKQQPIQQVAATIGDAASPFDAICQQLFHLGLVRNSGETLLQWVQRIHHPELTFLVYWHYQLRFKASGLSNIELKKFKRAVQEWSEKNREIITKKACEYDA